MTEHLFDIDLTAPLDEGLVKDMLNHNNSASSAVTNGVQQQQTDNNLLNSAHLTNQHMARQINNKQHATINIVTTNQIGNSQLQKIAPQQQVQHNSNIRISSLNQQQQLVGHGVQQTHQTQQITTIPVNSNNLQILTQHQQQHLNYQQQLQQQQQQQQQQIKQNLGSGQVIVTATNTSANSNSANNSTNSRNQINSTQFNNTNNANSTGICNFAFIV